MQYATDISRRMSGDDNDDDDDNDNDDAVSTDDNITDLDENAGGLRLKIIIGGYPRNCLHHLHKRCVEIICGQ